MRRVLAVFLMAALLLTGCTSGRYAASSHRTGTCAVSFTTPEACRLKVYVDDGKGHSVRSLEEGHHAVRRFGRASRTTMLLPSGVHRIRVEKGGEVLYCQELNMTSAIYFVIKL